MKGTTLKYYIKQASVVNMEASFNSDYDRLLLIAENYVRDQSVETYNEIFNLLSAEGSSKNEIETLLTGLVATTYASVDKLFRPWYDSSFRHLSNLTTSESGILYANSAERLATERSIAALSGLTNSVYKVDEINEGTADIFANRFARTETNSAVGGILTATALSMFAATGLYKRWISSGDERVRATHLATSMRKPIPQADLYLVGQTLMQYPADPQAFGGNAIGEIVNCRCRSLIMPLSSTQPNSNSLNGFLFGI